MHNRALRTEPLPPRRAGPIARGLAVLASACGLALPAAAEPVDLQLILAVDVSRSVDFEEATLQRQGYVDALQSPEILRSLLGGHAGKVAIAYFEWAGMGFQRLVADWTVVADEEDARALAAKIAAAPILSERRTSTSEAIDFGRRLFALSPHQSRRRVLDISGDGAHNWGRPVVQARDDAVREGITINGLPVYRKGPTGGSGISSPDLDLYYEHCVIGGPQAFVVVAEGYRDLAAAIRRKLRLEIAGLVPARPPVQRINERPPPDCSATPTFFFDDP